VASGARYAVPSLGCMALPSSWERRSWRSTTSDAVTTTGTSLRCDGEKACRGLGHVERPELNGHHPRRLVELPLIVEVRESVVRHKNPALS
jgi:hypothetical protein